MPSAQWLASHRVAKTWLEPAEYDALKTFCQEYHVPMAEAIRIAIAHLIRTEEKKGSRP